MDSELLIGKIYEAAFVPELWPNVLDAVAEVGGCFGGILIAAPAGNNIATWISSKTTEQIIKDFASDPRFQESNIRLQTGISLKYQGFLSNDLMYDLKTMEDSLVYKEFYFPRGLGWCAGSAIPLPNGDMAAFSLERRFDDGPVPRDALPRLNALFPHLARAATIATRLGLERAKAVVEALRVAGLPAAALGHNRKVLAANKLFEGMSQQVISAAFGRIVLANRGAQKLFQQALDQLDCSEVTRSIPVPATSDHPAAVLHIIPLVREATDVFTSASALVIATVLDRPTAPDAELLCGLFDLSSSEARVAREILAGRSTDEAASTLGLSRETVRFYLKGIFAKTGVSRQIDLTALLSGAVLPAHRD